MITAMPELREQELQEDDEFLILACDGIWENLTSQQVHPVDLFQSCQRCRTLS
jgi:protein phosphatase PTC2/3